MDPEGTPDLSKWMNTGPRSPEVDILEVIVGELETALPELSLDDVRRALLAYSTDNPNAFAGFLVSEIVDNVVSMIAESGGIPEPPEHKQVAVSGPAAYDFGPEPGPEDDEENKEEQEEDEEPGVEEEKAEECIICLDEMEEGGLMECGGGHIFHSACLTRWLRVWKTCPVCRRRVNEEKELVW